MNAFKICPVTKVMMLGLVLLFAQQYPTLAQTANTYQAAIPAPSDSTIISTIAGYRDDVRQSVLLVSQQPQVLTSLARQQAGSQQAFGDLIQSYGQTKQGWFYDIARYPDLLHTLATLPAGSNQSAVDALTKTLSPTQQESAWKLYRYHHDDLVQADNLNQQADQAFNNLITPLDVPTQTAFRQLIDMPDVLSLLTQQLDETTQLGRDYAVDPAGVTQNLTALQNRLDAQNKQELAEYQRQLDQDPQARQELQQAGNAYAQANGINPNPAWPNTPAYYGNPYSFWSGYPSWYGSPFWYPASLGYGTGFYYGLGGNMVVFGLPSFGFSNWFFNYGYGYYPHLYNRFNNYYTYTGGVRRGWTPGNAGFAVAARRAFGPTNRPISGRSSAFSGSRQYSNGSARVAAPTSRYQGMNTGGFRTQSMGRGSFGGGGMRSFSGGGGFHGGGHR